LNCLVSADLLFVLSIQFNSCQATKWARCKSRGGKYRSRWAKCAVISQWCNNKNIFIIKWSISTNSMEGGDSKIFRLLTISWQWGKELIMKWPWWQQHWQAATAVDAGQWAKQCSEQLATWQQEIKYLEWNHHPATTSSITVSSDGTVYKIT